MNTIYIEPEDAYRNNYDLIIIGGGIHGVMLFYEATKRNLKPLLLEKSEFGNATTANSLRIIHGGLRYLQKMDIRRFRESVKERTWFFKNFPDYISPLPCLMPIYNSGLKRKSVFRLALKINDLLSSGRNKDINIGNHLPNGKIISARETAAIFPLVDKADLIGGAIWYDAFMPKPKEILDKTLEMCSGKNAKAIKNITVTNITKDDIGVTGVTAVSEKSDIAYQFRSKLVVNCSGPWCRELAKKFDKDIPKLFKKSITWNILFDRPSLSTHALAISTKDTHSHTYFLVPHEGRILAGTGHMPCSQDTETPYPEQKKIMEFISNINISIPGLNLSENDILKIFSGFLPVTNENTINLTTRPVIHDHENDTGIRGLYSVSGIKFTTARHVAEKVLNNIIARHFKEI